VTTCTAPPRDSTAFTNRASVGATPLICGGYVSEKIASRSPSALPDSGERACACSAGATRAPAPRRRSRSR
jgi:hypothetical protein